MAAAALMVVLSPAIVHRHYKVGVVVQAWRDLGPHTTLLGKMRARLCTAWWLGPLRPECPRDPVVVCAVEGWRTTLSMLLPIKSPLPCLEEEVQQAWQDHYAFALVLLVSVCLVVMVVMAWAELILARDAPPCKDTFENSMAHYIKLKMENTRN